MVKHYKLENLFSVGTYSLKFCLVNFAAYNSHINFLDIHHWHMLISNKKLKNYNIITVYKPAKSILKHIMQCRVIVI